MDFRKEIYNKTTSLLRSGCFNRDLWVVTPVYYYISMFGINHASGIKFTEFWRAGGKWAYEVNLQKKFSNIPFSIQFIAANLKDFRVYN